MDNWKKAYQKDNIEEQREIESEYRIRLSENPDSRIEMTNLASILIDLASLTLEQSYATEALTLLEKICQNANPDDEYLAHIFHLYAKAYSLQFIISQETDVKSLKKAVEYDRMAIRGGSDSIEYFQNLASSLSILAGITSKVSLFDEALLLYNKTFELMLDEQNIRVKQWGVITKNIFWRPNNETKRRFELEVYIHYKAEADDQAYPVLPYEFILNSWALALGEKAKLTGDIKYYELAVERFKEALFYNTEDMATLENLGYAYWDLGEILSDEKYLVQAVRVFERMLLRDPDNIDVLADQATVLLKARSLNPEAVSIGKIRSICEKVQYLDPKEVYNLACLEAIEGNHEKCHGLLLQAQKDNRLPERDKILEDEDLESVKSTVWFKKLFLKEL